MTMRKSSGFGPKVLFFFALISFSIGAVQASDLVLRCVSDTHATAVYFIGLNESRTRADVLFESRGRASTMFSRLDVAVQAGNYSLTMRSRGITFIIDRTSLRLLVESSIGPRSHRCSIQPDDSRLLVLIDQYKREIEERQRRIEQERRI